MPPEEDLPKQNEYSVNSTGEFKADYKLAKKRKCDLSLLKEVMNHLISKKTLDECYKCHILVGKYKGYRECHIRPDWLLIYKIIKKENLIIFVRTGTHSDLFRD